MLPLDDLLVLDLSRVLSGPYCSMYLGDFGARVIKIERPGAGDDTRAFGPPFAGGEAVYYLSINRNKESVAIDLKAPAGRDLVRGLARRADVLLENFRPGTLERLGLGYDELARDNARLVFASISGYGQSGLAEYVDRPGYDLVIQGLGGIPSLTGAPDGPPYKVGTSIADLTAGLYALVGILVALHARARTGRGQRVDVSMLDGQISLLTYHAGIHFATGRVPSRLGNAHPSIVPYEAFEAADGYVNIAVGNDRQFVAFAAALERPELAADPRFATNAARVEHRAELLAILAPLVRGRSVAAWVAALERVEIPCGPIASVAEALAHPQVAARGMLVDLPHPTAGSVRTTAVPVKLSETPAGARSAPPLLGQHTAGVLAELCGLSPAELVRLEAEGVIEAHAR